MNAIYITVFNVQKLYVTPTYCIYVFSAALGTKILDP
jgi:hypothetical protein